jgi:hypothetical protein
MDTMVIKFQHFLFVLLIFDLLFYTTNILYFKVLFSSIVSLLFVSPCPELSVCSREKITPPTHAATFRAAVMAQTHLLLYPLRPLPLPLHWPQTHL